MVGANDVRTATHGINKTDHGGLCTSFQVFFGSDVNAANAPPQSWSYKLTSGFKWLAMSFPDQVYADYDNETNSPAETQYDVAMIGVSVAVGDTTGWFGLDPGQDTSQTLEQYGYPGSDPGMVKGAIAVTHDSPYNIYEANGDPMGPGASGGPLVTPGNTVVGVRSTGNTSGYASWADIGSVYG